MRVEIKTLSEPVEIFDNIDNIKTDYQRQIIILTRNSSDEMQVISFYFVDIECMEVKNG